MDLIDGRYEPIRTLGSGGMAAVLLARDRRLGREVAVKRLHAHLAADEAMAERFTREALAAAALSHPNVVTVHDAGADEQGPYLVMEYAPGVSLADRLGRDRRLPTEEAAAIGAAAAAALAHAHERGVVHRDVTPGNILLTADGQTKLADFGIARVSWDSTDLTRTATLIGTAAYFSPEQAAGREVGPASDVYSLGVVLYRMLTGRVPFDDEHPVATARAHVHDAPRPPSELAPVGSDLEAVVVRCLAKAPEGRPTAAQLAATLSGYGAGTPPAAAGTLAVSGTEPSDSTIALPGRDRSLDGITVGGNRRLRRAGWVLLAAVVLALVASFTAFAAGRLAGDEAAPAIPTTQPAPTTVPPSTTVASTTTTSSTTSTTLNEEPATVAQAIVLLGERLDDIDQGRSVHPRTFRELEEDIFELAAEWEDKGDIGKLKEGLEDLLKRIDEAEDKDRLDALPAAELRELIILTFELAGLDAPER